MGLEQVKSEILEEARQKADRIVKEAEEEAEEIVNEAETEAEKIEESTEEEIQDEKEAIRRKQLSNARMTARERKLRAKQRNLDAVFSNFRSELEEMDDTEREEFVQNCVDEAPFDIGEIRAGEKFKDAAEDTEFDVSEAEIDGILVLSEDRERRISFTLDKIIEDFRNRYRKEVSRTLLQ